jgi:hypothetical protein
MWSLFTSICQIPDFYLTPTNPMQPLFSRWYNPEKRCDVMVESSTISIEQKRVCKWECHWLYCPPNIFRMTCDRKCLEKHRYCQKSWFKNGDELSIILLWDSAFCFGITSHPWTKHVFPLSSCCFEIKRCFFQRVFLQNILIKLQHAIKINQSWRLKVFWLQK